VCEACHIRFIGPGPNVIRLMGDKARARETMTAAGVPIIPGSRGTVNDEKEAQPLASRIGYPVIVKAAAGGGGRGMRVVNSPEDLTAAMTAARTEAKAAFGVPDVYLEKYIKRPRHIEFQILGDSFGNIVTLGERECSIQRRHQKIVEESPSTALVPKLRRRMSDAALKVARSVGYQNAGTVEFLLDEEGRFYFIEMNTRIQVEHPVTEMVTGIDMIKEQIKIAAGESLAFRQEDIQSVGHSIECRINAEDPETFAPSPGKITTFHLPGGPGVRVDTAIYTGYTIPPYFDSMCLKLIVWSLTWEDALDRGVRALNDMRLQGVKTTAPYYQQILQNEDFRSGEFNTSFVDNHPELMQYSEKSRPEEIAIAIAAAIAAHAGL